jgi:uncharacterized membrane protein
MQGRLASAPRRSYNIALGLNCIDLDFLTAVAGIITQYFVDPLAHPNDYAPYNVVNTTTFAILALIAAYLIYKGLKKAKINTGSPSFYWAIVPFIALGSVVRVLVDASILPRSVQVLGYTAYPFVTPVVYVLVFLATVACMAGAKILSRGREEKFYKLLKWSGIALLLVAFAPLVPLFSNFTALAMVLALSATGLVAYPLVWKVLGLKRDNVEWMTAWSQSLDGAATFVGVSYYGYFEQHVVGNAIFAFFGTPFAFFLIKVAFGLLVAYLAHTQMDAKTDAPLKNYLLILVTIFGLAPGGRDTLRMLART